MKPSTKFEKIFNAFAARKGVGKGALRFFSPDGERCVLFVSMGLGSPGLMGGVCFGMDQEREPRD